MYILKCLQMNWPFQQPLLTQRGHLKFWRIVNTSDFALLFPWLVCPGWGSASGSPRQGPRHVGVETGQGTPSRHWGVSGQGLKVPQGGAPKVHKRQGRTVLAL
jgi:hypothetical protein